MNAKKIMIVDDEKDIISVIQFRLEMAGYEVHFTDKPLKAEALALKIKPNIILLDYRMPEITGAELCMRIKKKKALQNIPIIFITASTNISQFEMLIKAGACDWIMKPFLWADLLSKIHKYIS